MIVMSNIYTTLCETCCAYYNSWSRILSHSLWLKQYLSQALRFILYLSLALWFILYLSMALQFILYLSQALRFILYLSLALQFILYLYLYHTVSLPGSVIPTCLFDLFRLLLSIVSDRRMDTLCLSKFAVHETSDNKWFIQQIIAS